MRTSDWKTQCPKCLKRHGDFGKVLLTCHFDFLWARPNKSLVGCQGHWGQEVHFEEEHIFSLQPSKRPTSFHQSDIILGLGGMQHFEQELSEACVLETVAWLANCYP